MTSLTHNCTRIRFRCLVSRGAIWKGLAVANVDRAFKERWHQIVQYAEEAQAMKVHLNGAVQDMEGLEIYSLATLISAWDTAMSYLRAARSQMSIMHAIWLDLSKKAEVRGYVEKQQKRLGTSSEQMVEFTRLQSAWHEERRNEAALARELIASSHLYLNCWRMIGLHLDIIATTLQGREFTNWRKDHHLEGKKDDSAHSGSTFGWYIRGRDHFEHLDKRMYGKSEFSHLVVTDEELTTALSQGVSGGVVDGQAFVGPAVTSNGKLRIGTHEWDVSAKSLDELEHHVESFRQMIIARHKKTEKRRFKGS